MSTNQNSLQLEYTIVCEDVRLEMTRNLSIMGILHFINVPQLPVTVLKLAVVNHWRGGGRHVTEVRLVTPDRSQVIAASQPSGIEIPENGGADNVTVFTNLTFPQSGAFIVQTLVNSNVFSERFLHVNEVRQQQSFEAPGSDEIQ